MAFVHQQREIGAPLKNPLNSHDRIKHIVVIADHHVRDFAKRQGKLKRAQGMPVRHIRKPPGRSSRSFASFRPAPAGSRTKCPLARGQKSGWQRLKPGHCFSLAFKVRLRTCMPFSRIKVERLQRRLPGGGARGEVENLPRQPLAQRFERRIQHGGGFARAGRHAGKQPLFAADRGEHLHGHLPLAGAVWSQTETAAGQGFRPASPYAAAVRFPIGQTQIRSAVNSAHSASALSSSVKTRLLDARFALRIPRGSPARFSLSPRKPCARTPRPAPGAPDRPAAGNGACGIGEFQFLHNGDVRVEIGVHPAGDEKRKAFRFRREAHGHFRLPALRPAFPAAPCAPSFPPAYPALRTRRQISSPWMENSTRPAPIRVSARPSRTSTKRLFPLWHRRREGARGNGDRLRFQEIVAASALNQTESAAAKTRRRCLSNTL